MALYIKYKTRVSLTIATATESNACTGNTDQDAKFIGAVGSGGSWNVANYIQNTGASSSWATNTYYNDSSFNSSGVFTELQTLEMIAATNYGDGIKHRAYNYGSYYKATCSGGSSTMVERLVPNIDVTLLSQVGSLCTLKIEFPAYIDNLTGITATISNHTTGTTLGTITNPTDGDYITCNEYIQIGDIMEYRIDFTGVTGRTIFATCWVEYGSTVAPQNVENVNISNNSFLAVGGEQSYCGNEDCFCLPISAQTDIQTQITIDAISIAWNPDDLIATLSANTSTIFYITPCDECNVFDTSIATANLPITLEWERLNDFNSVIIAKMINNNSTLFNSYPVGKVFRLCVVRRDYTNYPTEWDDTSIGCSNICFKKISDTCYTTLVKYYNNEDAFCFYAKDTYYEKIRLPLHLKSMQPERKTKGYQKSNGEMVKLSDRITKSYTMKIDYMPEQLHDKLAIALAHDNVLLTDSVKLLSDTAIISQDDYKINWSDNDNISLGNAETKVYLQTNPCSNNSNC